MVYDLNELTLATPATVTEVPPPPPQEETSAPSRKRGYWHLLRVRFLISLVLCGLILTVPAWWPQGAAYLRQQAGEGEIGPVQAAAQTLVTDVLSGDPIPEAIAAFCQEVAHAQTQD